MSASRSPHLPEEPAVRAAGLGKRFGPRWGLREVDLTVERGRTVALVGPNGAGKTTLLRILATLYRPTHGTVEVFGHPVASRADAVRRRVSLVTAAGFLYDELTAEENLRFAALMAGRPSRPGEVEAALARVELPAIAGVRVRAFSTGMRKRLELARLLLRPADLLLLDEPYASLDAAGVELADEVLAAFRARGGTVILASHQTGAALRAADRIVVLEGGRVRAQGAPAELGAELRAAGLAPPPDAPRRRAGRRPPSGEAGGEASGAASDEAPGAAPDEPRDAAALGTASRDDRADPSVRSLWRRTRAIVWKDLLIEARTKGAANAMLFFAALVLFLFSFAIGPDPELLARLAGGLLWVGIAFTGTLALGRTFHSEELTGGLAALRLYPGEVRAIFFGKLLANLAVLLAVEALLFPAAAVLFQMDLWRHAPGLAGIAVLGTFGFSVVGTFYASLTVHLRAREVMLPLLLFPVLVPILLGAVNATNLLLDGDPLGRMGGWVRLLVAFDVIFFVLCTWIFPVVLEE